MLEEHTMQERIIFGDLLEACRSQQNCCRRLFYVYDRAQAQFQDQEGQPNPNSILVALQAACTGLLSLCAWLKEIGQVPGFDFALAGENMVDWCVSWLTARGIVLPPPDEL